MINISAGVIEWVRSNLVDLADLSRRFEPLGPFELVGAAELTAVADELLGLERHVHECAVNDLDLLADVLEEFYQRFVTTDEGLARNLGQGAQP